MLSLFAFVVAACSSPTTGEKEISETPSAVIITSGTGSVTVSAGDSGATVLAEISASGEEPEWTADMVGAELIIDDGCGDRTDCEVDFTITVDGTADVTIASVDGVVSVTDMNSSISISGAATDVFLNGITGPIDVALTEGDLIGARLVATTASFETGEGDLDVTLTEVPDNLSVVSGSGDVKAQVPGGGYDIDASTADGAVDISVDDVEGASSSILMRTESGDVTIYRR